MDPIGIAIRLWNMHSMMNSDQLSVAIDIEKNIAMLATFKLSMIAKNDERGYKRICKQQARAAKIGMQIIETLSTQPSDSHDK